MVATEDLKDARNQVRILIFLSFQFRFLRRSPNVAPCLLNVLLAVMSSLSVRSILFLSLKRDRKSSLVSRTSRQRRRSTPVSVRFADESALVQVIGPMEPVRRVGL